MALPVSSASAASGPVLVCNIQPSGIFTYGDICDTAYAASTYSIDFQVQGGSGTYSYAWTVPPHFTISYGCTSTSSECTLTIRGTMAEHDITMPVALTQGGTQTTLTAEAYIPAVCGKDLC